MLVAWAMQTVSELRAACQQFAGSAETFPFGLDTLVLKVGGRMYALLGLTHSYALVVSGLTRAQRAELGG